MSNAIVSLILVALMITTGLSFSKTALNFFSDMSSSWKQAEETQLRIVRSDISVISAQSSGDIVSIFLKNTGQVSLDDYSTWDVIVHFYDESGTYHINYIPYVKGSIPGNNQWVLDAIYTDQKLEKSEVFQPGMVDPGEAAMVQVKLDPAPGAETTGWVILASKDGITCSAQFTN
jgi:hypothetical protein